MTPDLVGPSELPQDLRERLAELSFASRSVAYVDISSTGRVLGWGGDLERYGLQGLELSADVCEHATFLFGMLPLCGDRVHLPVVRTDSGRFADVHLSATRDGACVVLFLDAHQEYDYLTMLQQWGNELRLEIAQDPRVSRTVAEVTVAAFRIRSREHADVFEDRAERAQRVAKVVSARGGLLLDVSCDSILIGLFGLVPPPAESTPAVEALRAARHALELVELPASPGIGIAFGSVALRGGARDGGVSGPVACGRSVDRALDLASAAVAGEILADETLRDNVPAALASAARPVRVDPGRGDFEDVFVFE